ncbi:MAG: Fur family transcriptional regulator [Pyrinomonadaceae bacterium]
MNDAIKDLEGSGSTKQRQAVLRVIRESDVHLTANEVFENAKRLLPGISFATVYNSLRYLKNEGLIGEVRFGTDAARYDRKLTRHDHAICTSCEKLVDLELSIPDGLFKVAAKRSKFKPESIELTLHGLCPECSKQKSDANFVLNKSNKKLKGKVIKNGK